MPKKGTPKQNPTNMGVHKPNMPMPTMPTKMPKQMPMPGSKKK